MLESYPTIISPKGLPLTLYLTLTNKSIGALLTSSRGSQAPCLLVDPIALMGRDKLLINQASVPRAHLRYTERTPLLPRPSIQLSDQVKPLSYLLSRLALSG